MPFYTRHCWLVPWFEMKYTNRISIRDSLLKGNKTKHLWKDESQRSHVKQIVYTNVVWASYCGEQNQTMLTISKAGQHQENVTVYLFGIGIHCLFLFRSWKITLNLGKTCSQLDGINAAINEKGLELASRLGFTSHVFLPIRQKFVQLGWLLHRPRPNAILTWHCTSILW